MDGTESDVELDIDGIIVSDGAMDLDADLEPDADLNFDGSYIIDPSLDLDIDMTMFDEEPEGYAAAAGEEDIEHGDQADAPTQLLSSFIDSDAAIEPMRVDQDLIHLLGDVQHENTGERQQPASNCAPDEPIPHLEAIVIRCPDCYNAYSRLIKLKEHHIAQHSKRQRFRCQLCRAKFSNRMYLKFHCDYKNRIPIGECPHCLQWITPDEYLMEEHIRTHHSPEATHRCRVCVARFLQPHQLVTHMQKAHPDFAQPDTDAAMEEVEESEVEHDDEDTTVLRCRHCGAPGRLKKHITEHIRHCHSGSQFKCNLCQATFGSRQALSAHKSVARRKLDDGSGWECPHCLEKIIGDRNAVTNHMFDHHKNNSEHACSQCHASFQTSLQLCAHMGAVHDSNGDEVMPPHSPSYGNGMNQVAGPSLEGLLPVSEVEGVLETDDHADLLPWLFDHCTPPVPDQRLEPANPPEVTPMAVNRTIPLLCGAENLSGETKDRFKHRCVICYFPARTEQRLRVHMACHEGGVKFRCVYCTATFSNRGYRAHMNSHIRVSTDKSLRECSHCLIQVPCTPLAMEQHIARYHLTHNPHRCTVCVAMFRTRRMLDQHYDTIHGGDRTTRSKRIGDFHETPSQPLSPYDDIPLTAFARQHHIIAQINEREAARQRAAQTQTPTSTPTPTQIQLETREQTEAHTQVQIQAQTQALTQAQSQAQTQSQSQSQSLPQNQSRLLEQTFRQAQDSREGRAASVEMSNLPNPGLSASLTRAMSTQEEIDATADPQPRLSVIRCTVCYSPFRQERNRVEHMKFHEAPTLYACPYCPAMFNRPRALRRHMSATWRRNADDSARECGHCLAMIPGRLREYNSHVETHHAGERAHKCGQCVAEFREGAQLAAHAREVHPDGGTGVGTVAVAGARRNAGKRQRGRERCEKCHHAFSSLQVLMEHEATAHGVDARFGCDYCDARFTSKRLRTLHQRVDRSQSGAKACPHCRMQVPPGEDALHSHVAGYHAPPNPACCPTCPARFRTVAQLVDHLREQHPDFRPARRGRTRRSPPRPAAAGSSAAHAAQRTAAGPPAVAQTGPSVACAQCRVRFPDARGAWVHENNDHPDGAQLKCPYCDARFASTAPLTKHQHLQYPDSAKRDQAECPHCGHAISGGPVAFLEHVAEVHAGFLAHSCPSCPARFREASQLERHMSSLHRPRAALSHSNLTR